MNNTLEDFYCVCVCVCGAYAMYTSYKKKILWTGTFMGWVLEKGTGNMFCLVKKFGVISVAELTFRIIGTGPEKIAC
jgi:hypothetical protein